MSADAHPTIAGIPVTHLQSPSSDSVFSRCWLAVPAWWGQVAGAAAMFLWLSSEVPAWWNGFWTMGAWYQFPDGSRINLPWTRVLVDLNILLVGLAFLFRRPARLRSARADDVLLALLAGWWPMLPFLAVSGLAFFDQYQAMRWMFFMQRSSLTLPLVLAGAALVMVGNAVDVWGYATLFRSFSVVPEARELKTTGLYRFVRHPVYLGQFISQAGVWLVFAPPHWFWWTFFGIFIALQLWRSRREDEVLELAFGDGYRAWKSQTFWFV